MAKSKESASIAARLKRERRRRWLRSVAELLLIILLGAVSAFIFFNSITLQKSAMSPTLQVGDRVLVNRAAYAVTGVGRGDIIAYRGSSSVDTGIHVKRVIGLPGETIQIRNGLILINGETYTENRDLPNISNAGLAEEGVTLGSDEYFVLGDNRNNSEDSRYADVGNIEKEDIIGKVWFRVSPFSSIGFLR